MKFPPAFTRAVSHFAAPILIAAALVAPPAHANGGGGGGGDGGKIVKLEAFTLNLPDMTKYLRVALTLQVADPKIGEAIKNVMPVVRHEMILLLSSKEENELNTAQGKRALAQEIQKAVNKLIKKDEHEGVTDIFYEAFIIQ